MLQELKPFLEYELAESNEALFVWRMRIEDARKELTEIKAKLDEELIRRMKEQNISSFEIALANGKNKITYGKKKTEKITDPLRLVKMLFSENEGERELSRKALSEGQSAWKIAQVRLIADTLGMPELIKTTFEEEIKLQIIPVEMLEKKGVL